MRLPNGCPAHGYPEKFYSIGGDTSDDWPFHAAVVEGDHVQVTVQSETPLKQAELNYTTDTGLRSKRTWTTIPATITCTTITDDRDAMASTTAQFR